jgi:hypothetical protein
VTDSSADAEEIARIEQAGIEVVVAGSDASLLRPMENGRTRLTDVRRPA